jgi:glutamyl-tRNA synthetase
MPLRKALTGQSHGPDMSAVLPLLQVIKAKG